jgi:hypothetical protein
MKTIHLKPVDLEFDSPKILGNELIVREHPPFSDQAGIRIRTRPQRVNLPIFDLETGEVLDRYYWYNETAGMACATAQSLTFIGQDDSTIPTNWVLFETKSAGSGRKGSSVTGR